MVDSSSDGWSVATYDSSVHHLHEFLVNFVRSNGMNIHPCLVGQEDDVLSLDHDGGDAKEDSSKYRSVPTAIAARRHYMIY